MQGGSGRYPSLIVSSATATATAEQRNNELQSCHRATPSHRQKTLIPSCLGMIAIGHSNLYPPPLLEYGYPYQPPPSRSGVYPPPPPPQGYQGYFTDEYPPPQPLPPSQPYYRAYDDDDGSCLSFLQGCIAAICCCCLLEKCCY
nr:PREDICTED: cysteine-rich and transmembrane domain-containing protein A-like isoform X1 [Musa acuminata subsp. malaccensis]